MPIDESAFDKQFLDISNGTGKQRTIASGLFLIAMEKVCQPPYSIVAAWQIGTEVHYTMRVTDDEGHMESWHAIDAADVTADTVMALAQTTLQDFIDYQRNPPSIMWKADSFDHYLALCLEHYPDAVPICQEVYGRKWQAACVEIGYWHEHQTILPNFMYLQNVIEESGSLIFVHKDKAKEQ